MGWRWFSIGIVMYALCTLVLFPMILGIPEATLYTSDDAAYSTAAMHILRDGFYSLDGVHAYYDREPGQSVLLAFVFWVFGEGTHVGLYIVQAILLFVGAAVFAESFAVHSNKRAAGFTFVLLLTSGSVLHTVFSGYRECLTLVLLLLFTSIYLATRNRTSTLAAVLMGVTLGCTILTYYSFVLLPVALIPLWLLDRRSLRDLVIVLVVTGAIVSGWAYRNYRADGHFRVVDERRANVMWFVRGEQAIEVTGLEPLRCLWAEYISRDWTGLSPSCSFNAVMHRMWPTGFESPNTTGAGRVGVIAIRQNFASYLWLSVVEIIELHIPYVGGGWSTKFNVYAALTQALLYMGCLLAITKLFDPRYRILLLIATYNVGVFVLTDATPRYLVPTLFCYAAFAGIGYSGVLKPRIS